MTQPASFVVVGAGWRARSFIRIAKELPQCFRVSCVIVKDAAKAAALQHELNVPCETDVMAALRRERPEFALLAVPWAVTPVFIRQFVQMDLPVLAETPPAPDFDGLRSLAPIALSDAPVQVAEQYPFAPMHAARLAVAASGRLGTVSFAEVSVAHGYHGLSLLRRLLGVGFQPPRITARLFTTPIVAGPGRDGLPDAERVVTSTHALAWLDFGDRLGVFNFCDHQYFSWIRSRHLRVQGDRGELQTNDVRWLGDFRTPLTSTLERIEAGPDGNLEGQALRGIIESGRMIYENPFFPARLSDDEIAMATVLTRMREFVRGGPSFYSLADACQDHHLGMCVDQAAAMGSPLQVESGPWVPESR